MSIIHDELKKLGIVCNSFSVLQDKDGITAARIVSGAESYVLKCFPKDEYKREIENYRLLASLEIPTIRVIASTDSALILEDVEYNSIYRLGTQEDMSAPNVARRIAVW